MNLLKLLLPLGVPHRSRDTAATQLCHYTWLWINLCGYWHSCTLWHCSHGTGPRREDKKSHKGHRDEQWSLGHTGRPCSSLSLSTSKLGSEIPAAT